MGKIEDNDFSGWEDKSPSIGVDKGNGLGNNKLKPISYSRHAKQAQEIKETVEKTAEIAQKVSKASKEIITGGVEATNNWLKDNVTKHINDSPVSKFGAPESATGGGGSTGKPPRTLYHGLGSTYGSVVDPVCTSNAIVQCPFGMTFCKMQATPRIKTSNVEGLMNNPLLTIYDHLAFVNVFPYNLFTLCQNPFNPFVIAATAAATAAKGGIFTFTPWPCISSLPPFSTIQPSWIPTQGKIQTNGQFVLTQSAQLLCWWPASISIVHPGQGLDASWGKAMFLGPGGLAGIMNLVSMAGSVFSMGSAALNGMKGTAQNIQHIFNLISAGADVTNAGLSIMNGDIVGGLFSMISAGIGVHGEQGFERTTRQLGNAASEVLENSVRTGTRIESRAINDSINQMMNDMPLHVRTSYANGMITRENMMSAHPNHTTNGIIAPSNGPHGDTIHVPSSSNATTPSSGKAVSNNATSSQASTSQKSKTEIAHEQKKAVDSANKNLKNNPAPTQKERENLDKLKGEKDKAKSKLDDNPAPSEEEKRHLSNLKDKADEANQSVKNNPAPTDREKNQLSKLKEKSDEANQKVENNPAPTDEEYQHLSELETKSKKSWENCQKRPSNTLEDLENDTKIQNEYTAEKKRIEDKQNKHDEAVREAEEPNKAYREEKERIDALEEKHQQAKDKAQKANEAYQNENSRQTKAQQDHDKAKQEYDNASKSYKDEEERLLAKDIDHAAAQHEADIANSKYSEESRKILEEEEKAKRKIRKETDEALVKDIAKKYVPDTANADITTLGAVNEFALHTSNGQKDPGGNDKDSSIEKSFDFYINN